MMAGTIQPTDVGAPVLAVDVGGGEVVTVGGYVVASYISVPFSTCH
jgi:cystathionine beta-lyase family protein involved in aluminum resistance